RLSNRAVSDLERMADRHERRSFGHTVTLHDSEPEPLPEALRFFIQRRAARYERPELPTEPAMYVAEDPPAPKKMFAFGRGEAMLKIFQQPLRRIIAFNLFAQSFELARDAGDHREPFPFNCRDDFRRIKRALEKDFAGKQPRHEHAHKLTEDVAERQQAQKPDWVEWALELQVPGDLGFEWRDVRQQVPMRQADTFRLRRR